MAREARAQSSVKISGVVRDARGGAPMEGVVVGMENIAGETSLTDANGHYELDVQVDKAMALRFTYAGYRDESVFLHGRTVIDVSLSEVGYSDNPVVVTPMRVTRRHDFVHSGTTVGGDRLREYGYLTLDQALAGGAVPGLKTNTQAGLIGSGAMMNLRGPSSINGGTEPLIVVDGAIYETDMGSLSAINGFTFNPLMNLNLRDIDQVTVVKSGMTSVYGSLGANGVIFVTTKDSRETATTVNVNTMLGVSMAPKSLPVLNADQFKSYAMEQMMGQGLTYSQIRDRFPFILNEAEKSEKFRYLNDTDWQDEIYQDGVFQKYSVDIEGGDEVANYTLSLGHSNNDGVIKNTSSETFDFRMNASLKLLDKLLVRPRVSLSKTTNHLREEGYFHETNPVLAALSKSPMMGTYRMSDYGVPLPFYDEVGPFGISNPNALIDNMEGQSESFRINAGFDASYDLGKGLSAVFISGLDVRKIKERIFVPSTGVVRQADGEADNAMADATRGFLSYYTDGALDYNALFRGKHSLLARIGARVRLNEIDEEKATDINSPSDEIKVIGTGDRSNRTVTPLDGRWNTVSFYGSADYAYLDKYYLSVNAALDGSSRFSPNKRYGIFPSVAGAWRLSSEPFLKGIKNLSDLKLRASYSITGNDDIGNYSGTYFYSSRPYMNVGTLVRGAVPNADLTWETSEQLAFGLDLSLYDNRFRASVDYFQTEISDMLMMESLPSYYGRVYYLNNSATAENKGVEFTVQMDIIRRKDFGFEMGVNWGTYANKITEISSTATSGEVGSDMQVVSLEGGESVLKVGEPIGSFYGWKTAGVIRDSQQAEALALKDGFGRPFKPGDMAFEEMGTPNNIIDEDDRTVIGNTTPDFFGAVNFRFRYKSLNMSMNWDYMVGHDIFNYVRMRQESMSSYANQSEAVTRRWRQEGDETDMPRATYGDPMGNGRFSGRWIEDGSYLRLRDVTVSYDVNVNRLKLIRSLRVFATGQNLLTFTDYLGYTPDVAYGRNTLTQGIDYGRTPLTRALMMGIRLGI
ncbi:SusC/RagA family TonB-linked outer membrane protein (plasmid) [Fulvitalea axinellae]|uniref:SusC/RagA family TonB-linked outer membrane protein n=2 Tax=Fulvitalea axinellae TaxID=1182444 RepID=A0AAU9CQ91_9BACT|nr:SusC/RagA family TonB-linked outer membrane protein [Fulvitalea axinellae]